MIELVEIKPLSRVKPKELVIRNETWHDINLGQYLIDKKETFIRNNINVWATGPFEYKINWFNENYPDTKFLYKWVWNEAAMSFRIFWYFVLPSQEALVHYQLSDIPYGGDWF